MLLSQRIQSAMLMSADPFAKVKGMIQEMIEKLVEEAQKEASHKAFCDKEMSETKAKRDDKQTELDDLNTKNDKATGAASGIIGMLEVIESDFTKMLADGTAKEEMAVAAYEKLTQDNKIATTEKSTAVKYATK